MKRRILVTGANGYIGNALIQDLLAKHPEYTICGAARRGRILKTDVIPTFQVGSLEDHPDYSKALRDCDTVVHCALLVSPRKDSGWIESICLSQSKCSWFISPGPTSLLVRGETIYFCPQAFTQMGS